MKKYSAILAIALALAAFAFAQNAPAPAANTGADNAATAAPVAPAAPAPAAAAPAATAPAPAAAPAAAPVAVPVAAPAMALAESARYIVYSEAGAARAADLDTRLEALFSLYNSLFHFDATQLGSKLRVREFATKAGFDAYLNQVAGQTKDDFVYLHFTALERSELLLFVKDGADAEASLAHQAFVQYLKAFVRNPPLWLRDGFAVFFESARWDADAKDLVFPENLAWLETVKAFVAKDNLIPLDKLLVMAPEESRSSLEVFYPEAWAFVSFLFNAEDRAYNRLLWDSISSLKADAELAANQESLASLVMAWYGKDETQSAFEAYLEARKTFPELLQAGVAAYDEKAYKLAQEAFETAARLDSSSYVPAYYLGLIAYAAGDYSLAEYNYRTALELGCDPATTNYALGVNAFAQNRASDAKTFLIAAKTASPERYEAKAGELLKRLGM